MLLDPARNALPALTLPLPSHISLAPASSSSEDQPAAAVSSADLGEYDHRHAFSAQWWDASPRAPAQKTC